MANVRAEFGSDGVIIVGVAVVQSRLIKKGGPQQRHDKAPSSDRLANYAPETNSAKFEKTKTKKTNQANQITVATNQKCNTNKNHEK